MSRSRSSARFRRNHNQYLRDRSKAFFAALPAYVADGNEWPEKGDKLAWAAYRVWVVFYDARQSVIKREANIAKQKKFDDMIAGYERKIAADKAAKATKENNNV